MPVFLDSNSARVSTCWRMRPARREIQAPFSRPGILAHGPRNACQHDCTAASTCSVEAGVTRKSSSLTDGSRTSWATPPTPVSQRPPIRTWASSPARGNAVVGVGRTNMAVIGILLEYLIIRLAVANALRLAGSDRSRCAASGCGTCSEPEELSGVSVGDLVAVGRADRGLGQEPGVLQRVAVGVVGGEQDAVGAEHLQRAQQRRGGGGAADGDGHVLADNLGHRRCGGAGG